MKTSLRFPRLNSWNLSIALCPIFCLLSFVFVTHFPTATSRAADFSCFKISPLETTSRHTLPVFFFLPGRKGHTPRRSSPTGPWQHQRARPAVVVDRPRRPPGLGSCSSPPATWSALLRTLTCRRRRRLLRLRLRRRHRRPRRAPRRGRGRRGESRPARPATAMAAQRAACRLRGWRLRAAAPSRGGWRSIMCTLFVAVAAASAATVAVVEAAPGLVLLCRTQTSRQYCTVRWEARP